MATADAAARPELLAPSLTARRASAGFWSDAFWRVRHDPTTVAAFVVLLIVALLSASADLLADNFFHWSYSKQDILSSYRAPTLEDPAFWLGSDQLGRSQIVRVLYAGRISLFIGVFAAIVSLLAGVTLGISAGYIRGKWDDFVVWAVTTLNSIPTLFLLLIIGFLFRLDPLPLAILIGLLGWTGICNLARGQTFAYREREFVLAARTIGARRGRIMFRHLFPNILPLLIVVAMIDVAGVILLESGLSFLGFGVQPPNPSWGNMLTNAQLTFNRGPWLVYPPGVMIGITVLCLYVIGDGLRDALDPRLRGTT